MSCFTVTVPHQSKELSLLSDNESTPYGSTSASEFVSSNPLLSDEPEGPNVQIKRDNKNDGGNIDVRDQHIHHNGRGSYRAVLYNFIAICHCMGRSRGSQTLLLSFLIACCVLYGQ